MYGVWIAATLAQPGDTIVLGNRAVTKAVIHPPHQSSDYDLHRASYSLVTAKHITIRWARAHRDPKKAHNLQDYQDRMGNELADGEAKTASTMHLGKGAGSTSPANILLNKHVMPPLARKWIVKAQPQKLTPDAHWTSWLPLFAFNGDLGFGASNVGLDMEHHWKPSHHGSLGAVQDTVWASRNASFCARHKPCFGPSGERHGKYGDRKLNGGLCAAIEDERRMCTRLQVPVSL